MSLQITIAPLSSKVNLATSCAKFFQAVEHHPRTEKRPFDTFVLTTAAGTQIEAVFHSQTLSLNAHRNDLHDASFGEALFEIAAHGPCAVWEENADVAAVADPQFIEKAAGVLGLEQGLIEPLASGADLFDLLFGVDPPRTASPDLAPGLLELTFHIDQSNHQRANLSLPNGIFLELDPDEHFGWLETEGVSLGFGNPKFANVMSAWTPDLSGPLAKLDARKARQDEAGFLLWSGHLRFGQLPATLETIVLGVYEQGMPLGSLIERLTKTTSSKALAQEVFGGPLSPFVMPTEGLWVFLFLMTEAGCDRVEILDSYNKLKSEGTAFGTKNNLSLDIIDAYLELHQSRLGKLA